jgi:hypothetical protein
LEEKDFRDHLAARRRDTAVLARCNRARILKLLALISGVSSVVSGLIRIDY